MRGLGRPCAAASARKGGSPQAFVDGPDLHALAGGRRIPHLYQQKPPKLCLYLPRTYEWQSWMRLDQSIVPWTALWLFYFEEWLSSNEWKGGGMHPEPGQKSRREAASVDTQNRQLIDTSKPAIS